LGRRIGKREDDCDREDAIGIKEDLGVKKKDCFVVAIVALIFSKNFQLLISSSFLLPDDRSLMAIASFDAPRATIDRLSTIPSSFSKTSC
jgi:hypothetical protein